LFPFIFYDIFVSQKVYQQKTWIDTNKQNFTLYLIKNKTKTIIPALCLCWKTFFLYYSNLLNQMFQNYFYSIHPLTYVLLINPVGIQFH